MTCPPCSANMLLSLSDFDASAPLPGPDDVGGKALGLVRLRRTFGKEHVPDGLVLTAEFFRPWIEAISASEEWKVAQEAMGKDDTNADDALLENIKALAHTLPQSSEQAEALAILREAILGWPDKVAAVRSSAPEEDGEAAAFAGIFETKLGVPSEELEGAVRECFASAFDRRVLSYWGGRAGTSNGKIQAKKPSIEFAAVVMEMVDASKAGVAFSANPLNSDLDEMVVDSSWGLGESVVGGTVESDRYVWDKLANKLLEAKLGSKEQERRLGKNDIDVLEVAEERRKQATLSTEELIVLSRLVSTAEAEYGAPVDVEWAYDREGQLKLLQTRPITTLFPLDPGMLTSPGEPRKLYFDYHIASDATTTNPFTTMDKEAYWDIWSVGFGFEDLGKLPDDPDHLMFNGQTRQYINMSALSRLGYGPAAMAKEAKTIDLYAASILGGDEASRGIYRAESLPADVTFSNAWWLLRKVWKPSLHAYNMTKKFKKDPLGCCEELEVLRAKVRSEMKKIVARGALDGLVKYTETLCQTAKPVLLLQSGGAWMTVGIFKELSKQQEQGKTKQIQDDASAMMLGFTGDPLMEMNIAMYRLAQELPVDIWDEYDEKLPQLAERIDRNVSGKVNDLSTSFITSWKHFIEEFGYDGSDQLFVSSPRYHESPVLLLEKIRHSAGPGVKDPEHAMIRARQKRQEAQERQLNEAKSSATCLRSSVKAIQERNQALDHIMWIRNAPKLFLSEISSAVRTGVLSCETLLLETGRLDEAGDIFHLKMDEVDQGLSNASLDLRAIIGPRKAQYSRAKQATICPFLVDSRCRILKANVKEQEPGTLVGMPISPGVATGTVRILTNPREKLNNGDLLATVVTDPSWTPLFIGCSAVILQVGGVLQHGALCAREYGVPGVSCIDMADLKSGMKVSVDGNTGVIKILE